jgi:hypothetical protein
MVVSSRFLSFPHVSFRQRAKKKRLRAMKPRLSSPPIRQRATFFAHQLDQLGRELDFAPSQAQKIAPRVRTWGLPSRHTKHSGLVDPKALRDLGMTQLVAIPEVLDDC